MSSRSRRGPLAIVGAALIGISCIMFTSVSTKPISTASGGRQPLMIESPAKAHLKDGSVVVYPSGLPISGDSLRGVGVRYSIDLSDSAAAKVIPLDSLAALESFSNHTNVVPTVMVGVVTVAASVALLKAIFGSCPTIYSDSAGIPRLEAEAFSYSIAPLFEKRDLHPLRAQPDAAGVLTLQVRNEALETHYIDVLSLLEVAHAPDETVVVDGDEQPLAVGRWVEPASIRDRMERDIKRKLLDGGVFSTDSVLLRHASSGDLDDRLDLAIARPIGGWPANDLAVVLDLRNSLLNTVLLYDAMLAPQGADAIDYLQDDPGGLLDAWRLGEWYGSRFGLRISVWRPGGYVTVARIPDAGPIAWRTVAAVVPVRGEDTLRVRLEFVADDWRIRGLHVALGVRRPEATVVHAARIRVAGAGGTAEQLQAIAGADGRYLSTTPGQSFDISFDVGRAPGATRTFLLTAQGYYTEWIRGAWVRDAATPVPFTPNDSALAQTLRSWYAKQAAFEASFFATKVAVR